MQPGNGLENIESAMESISAVPSLKSTSGLSHYWETYDFGSNIRHFPSTKLLFGFIIRLSGRSKHSRTAMAGTPDLLQAFWR
jgi:hypothetical protein